jgi:hypothetical protein
MLRKILFCTCLFISPGIFAQTTYTVDFNQYTSDVDNDLKNNFIGNYTFNQQSSGGITGGAIKIDSNYTTDINHIADFAALKDTFDITGTNISTDISFKYIAATTYVYEAVRLKIQTVGVPDWTMSERIDAYYQVDAFGGGDLVINTVTYSGSVSINDDLIDGNWYQLKLNIQKDGAPSDSVLCSAFLYDLGTTGVNSPQLVASNSAYIGYLEDFYNPDYDIMVGITGNIGGGAAYLDNFSATGKPLNPPVSIDEINWETALSMPTLVNDLLPIRTKGLNGDINYSIFNLEGKLMANGRFNAHTEVDVNSFVPGNYIISFTSEGHRINKRFIKQY